MDAFSKVFLLAIAFAAVWGIIVYGRRILKEWFGVDEPLATRTATAAAALLWLIAFIIEEIVG